MINPLPSTTAVQQRVIRVFVSSTFRDMQAERDELVKRTFPQLRKLCEERSVIWSEVDLRWGITEEQSQRGEVLPVCLAEIQRCRPYFIGLLGERYGWIPDELSPELIEQEEWLKEHLNHSVTELEILHGVLNDPQMNDHALFYFRDSAYFDSLSDTEKAEFIELASDDEIRKYGQSEAERRADARKQKLTSLKERIREHCEKNKMPQPRAYPTSKELGEIVLRDMTDVIERLYPKDEIPEPLDRDALEHEAFAQSRAKVYIGRRSYFDRLDKHAQSEDQPLVVMGESGSGKSALLSNWALQYHRTHPEDLLIMHFIGATPYSADWAAMLRRIMGELRRRFDIQQEIPDKPDELKSAFTSFLHLSAANGRVVLILDALNQLEDRDGASDLVWLTPVVPPNVRMILSTLPSRSMDTLKERGWTTFQIDPLSVDERKRLIPEYLAQYSKKLDEQRAEHIANAEQTANPLFLRALLDELRVFGIYEKLDERIEHYLEAPTVDKLYEKILERYEQDYERERPILVKDAMSVLWAARHGLSEAELMDLLGGNRQPLPRAYWSPLFLAVEQSLVNRSGLIGFFHEYLRQAVQNRYLSKKTAQRSAHLQLGEYFQRGGLLPRRVEELPWQLSRARSWKRLSALLAEEQFLVAAMKTNSDDVKIYWSEIEKNSALRLVDVYGSVLARTALDLEYLLLLGNLLGDTGHHSEAHYIWEPLARHFRQTGDLANLQQVLNSEGDSREAQGDLDGALLCYREQERICRDLDFLKGDLARCLGAQAEILRVRGDFEPALDFVKEQARISREIGDELELSASLAIEGTILWRQGYKDLALLCYEERERIGRKLGRNDVVYSSLGNQAGIYADQGDLKRAERLLDKVKDICDEFGDNAGLCKTLANQASIFFEQGDLDRATTLCKQGQRLANEMDLLPDMATLLGNQARILAAQRRPERARQVSRKEEQIYRKLNDAEGVATSLARQAGLLAGQLGRPQRALPLIEESWSIASKHGFLPLAAECESVLRGLRKLLEGH